MTAFVLSVINSHTERNKMEKYVWFFFSKHCHQLLNGGQSQSIIVEAKNLFINIEVSETEVIKKVLCNKKSFSDS